MFIGHYGVALAAKRACPDLSLGELFAATQLMDVASGALQLAGIERVRIHPRRPGPDGVEMVRIPFSHSIPAALGLAAAGAVATRRRRGLGAGATAGVVASHYLLDVLAHESGIPIITHDVEIGLSMTPRTGVVVETALLTGGLVSYLRHTTPVSPIGRFAVPAMAVGLAALNAYVATSSPPRSTAGLALSNLGAYAVIAGLAHRLDRHRRPRTRAGRR